MANPHWAVRGGRGLKEGAGIHLVLIGWEGLKGGGASRCLQWVELKLEAWLSLIVFYRERAGLVGRGRGQAHGLITFHWALERVGVA